MTPHTTEETRQTADSASRPDAHRTPTLDEPAIRPAPDTPADGDKGPGAPADEDTPDPDEYADPDAPSR